MSFFDDIKQYDTLGDGDGETLSREMPAPIAAEPQFKEKCPKCNGAKVFRGRGGRVIGDCYACKGRGFKLFKTSPEMREKTRTKRVERKEAKAHAWREAHPDLWRWMSNNSDFAFAVSMRETVAMYGELTVKQQAACEKCAQAWIERAERRAREQIEREQAKQQREANAPVCDVTAIVEAFATARAQGVKRPKMRLAGFTVSVAPATGKNAGALYVTRGDTYLGKIAANKFHCTRECDAFTEADIVNACADPRAAAIAYGIKYGVCAVCGKELSNKKSIALGIGPICASRFGW